MPVFFVITNDGDQPVSLVGMKAQLNTKDRSKLLPFDHGRSGAPAVASFAE